MKKRWGFQAQKRASPRCQPRLCREELRVKVFPEEADQTKHRLFPFFHCQDRKRKRDDKKDKSVGHVEVIESYSDHIRHSAFARKTLNLC